MSGIRKAIIFSVLTQHSVQFIGLISTVIIARLLTPSEIGVFAIASSIAILAIELRSLGVGQYLIREKILSVEKIRSALGVMTIISWGLGFIIIAIAPFVKSFYGEPALSHLLWIISGGFFLAPFTSVPHALLTREMKFHQLLVVKVLTNLALAGSSIGLVWLGFSYYGLAFGVLIGALTDFLVINYYAPADTPKLPSFRGIRSIIHFGVFISVSQLFVRFSDSISDLVIGRTGTMADVGLFSRGLGLILFLNKIIVGAAGPVILPYLSGIKRTGNSTSVGDAYLRVIVLQAAFSLPVFAIVNVAAYPIIRIMFGDQWDIAIPIASTLSIWGMLQAIHYYSTTALISTGDEKLMFNASLVVFAVRMSLVIGAAIVITPFNLMAIAWALVISGLVELVVKTLAIRMATGLTISRLFIAFIPNILITLACWATLMIFDREIIPFDQIAPWKSVAVIAVSMPIVWLITLRLTKHELWGIILKLGRDILQRKNT